MVNDELNVLPPVEGLETEPWVLVKITVLLKIVR